MIGRDFLYEILKKITELEERIDGELSQLERLDLIRTRSLQPDIEYMFKHALTQEIVYNGLLKKQRREIHEHIARVMESVFKTGWRNSTRLWPIILSGVNRLPRRSITW